MERKGPAVSSVGLAWIWVSFSLVSSVFVRERQLFSSFYFSFTLDAFYHDINSENKRAD
jgi:hypothetical protein